MNMAQMAAGMLILAGVMFSQESAPSQASGREKP
jgi:hypothetical protein